jgi:hypothetical protein
LPYRDRIQRSFGRFGIANVRAHSAPGANEALGSQAYTMGDHVAFAGHPTLFTAAHEAAHVVQLRGEVGQAGDAYERHADRVAHEVIAGRSAEGTLARMVDGGGLLVGVQKKVVQFWGSPPGEPKYPPTDHPDFTRDAVDRWNGSHPRGTREYILEHLKTWMVKCSDDPDHSGRALTGTISDLGIYYDALVGGKKRRRAEYAAGDPAKKKRLYAAAMKSICASEGPAHGEGKRPKYGSGGKATNIAHTMGQIKWASWATR